MKAGRTIDLALAVLLVWWLRRPLWDGCVVFARLLWRLLHVVAVVAWWWLRGMLRMVGLALIGSLGARA